MRLQRIFITLLGIYLVFIGGSAYYQLIFPVRWLHPLLITTVTGVWLLNRIRQRQGFPHSPLNQPLLAAVAVWVITALFGADPRMAIEHIWFPIIHIILFLMLVDLMQRGRDKLLWEAQFMLVAVVIFLSALETASWYFGLGITPGTNLGWVDVIGQGAWLPLQPLRLSLTMNISTLLAGYAAPLVSICAVFALTTHRRDYRIVFFGLAAILLLILIFTFSRGGILSLLTAGGIWLGFQLWRLPAIAQRNGFRVLIGATAIVGVVGLASISIITISQNSNRSFGDAGRLDMWRSAVLMLRDHPLTGVGPGLFGRAFRDYRDPALAQDKLASAHNAFLNTAAETGLPGIIVSLWLLVACMRTWYARWKNAPSSVYRQRLEICLAALLGLGIHSLVDVFTITPIVLLMLLLVAYMTASTTPEERATVRTVRQGWRQQILPAAAILLLVAYAGWFIRINDALNRYLDGFRQPETSIQQTQQAAALDSYLRLYPLYLAFRSAQNSDLSQSIAAYREALALEPTWDTGWMNLAALELRAGNIDAAIDHLDRARQINALNPASLYWGILNEEQRSASDEAIIDAYLTALKFAPSLPLSDIWWESPLRQQALQHYLPELSVEHQYRILRIHAPDQAAALIPTEPQTAADWWIVGESALTTGETQRAIDAFTQSILLSPTAGDYYAARARAYLALDQAAADRDLNIAQLLGTYAEHPSAIRATMTTNPDDRYRLRVVALPPRPTLQEFAAVLYGRPAQFDLLPEMRWPGPGRAAMQPWYDIAAERLASGQIDEAIRAYQAILDYAPDEQEARDMLEQLTRHDNP